MAHLAKFPIKQKTNKQTKKLTTYDRRMIDIKRLDGKYNGWWIYQYAMGEYGLRVNKSKLKRR